MFEPISYISSIAFIASLAPLIIKFVNALWREARITKITIKVGGIEIKLNTSNIDEVAEAVKTLQQVQDEKSKRQPRDG